MESTPQAALAEFILTVEGNGHTFAIDVANAMAESYDNLHGDRTEAQENALNEAWEVLVGTLEKAHGRDWVVEHLVCIKS